MNGLNSIDGRQGRNFFVRDYVLSALISKGLVESAPLDVG